MNVVFVISLFVAIFGGKGYSDPNFKLCENGKLNPNFVIYQVLRVEDRLILVIDSKNDFHYYGLKIDYHNSVVKLHSIRKLENVPGWFKQSFLLFTMLDSTGHPYPTTVRYYKVNKKTVGTQFELGNNFEITNPIYFDLSGPLNADDGSDKLNLFPLLINLPQIEDIYSIMSFPYGYLQNRVFIYYQEFVNTSTSTGRPLFKRHLFMGRNDSKGFLWRADKDNGECVEQNSIDAVFPLSKEVTQTQTGSLFEYFFDLIEFKESNYSMKRVNMWTNATSPIDGFYPITIVPNLTLLKSGLIQDLFDCNEMMTTMTTIITTTTTGSTPMGNTSTETRTASITSMTSQVSEVITSTTSTIQTISTTILTNTSSVIPITGSTTTTSKRTTRTTVITSMPSEDESSSEPTDGISDGTGDEWTTEPTEGMSDGTESVMSTAVTPKSDSATTPWLLIVVVVLIVLFILGILLYYFCHKTDNSRDPAQTSSRSVGPTTSQPSNSEQTSAAPPSGSASPPSGSAAPSSPPGIGEQPSTRSDEIV